MDWQLRIALIVLGAALIGFIFYDFNRRKKAAKEKQKLIDQMHQAAETVDSAGFDYTGVGNARVANKEPQINDEKIKTDGSVSEPVIRKPQTSTNEVEELNSANTDVDNKSSAKAVGEQLSFSELVEPEKVYSLILKAEQDKTFKGQDFMPLFLSQGLRHGEMGIFHRSVSVGGKPGPTVYSVANAVKPGTFDLNNIEQFETPAFAFFMTLPGPKDPAAAYDGMVKTIRMLEDELGGQILDQSKSVYTEQTHQHQLDEIRAYLSKVTVR